MQLLLGILNKHTRLNTFRRNVFVNVVAGLQMTEPSTDLPIAMAIASSVCDKPVPHDMVFFGEIGLAGELRSVIDPRSSPRVPYPAPSPPPPPKSPAPHHA